MFDFLKKKTEINIEPQPCPQCGGRARIHRIGLKKYIVYCPFCSVCTPATWEYKDDAIDNWNYLNLDDLRLEDYCVTGVASVAFSEVTPIISENSSSFYCETVGISFCSHKYTETVIEMGHQYMFCNRCSQYGRIYHDKEIADQNTDIRLVGCEREHGYLKTITFQCGEKSVVISADSEAKRILVNEFYQ